MNIKNRNAQKFFQSLLGGIVAVSFLSTAQAAENNTHKKIVQHSVKKQARVTPKKNTVTRPQSKKIVMKKPAVKGPITNKHSATKKLASSKSTITKPVRKKILVAVEPVWASIVGTLVDKEHWSVSALIDGNTDPHGTSLSPNMAKILHNADLAVVNGGGYDNWAKSPVSPSHLILVSSLAEKENIDPHYFLDPIIVERLAHKVSDLLLQKAPTKKEHSELMNKRAAFNTHITLLKAKMGRLHSHAFGKRIAMTELAGEALLKQAGFIITDETLALAATDGRSISPQQQARLEEDIKGHKIAFLVVNSTHAGGPSAYLETLAREHKVPVVAIPEALPAGKDWVEWINAIVDDVEAALAADKLGIMN